VRRIFESLGYDVRRLDRRRFATLSTSGLKRGEYRQLTKTEVRDLRSLVGLDLVF
jgi:16S rRNA U516 pseudouridylate synthase RsuA-like enzyme